MKAIAIVSLLFLVTLFYPIKGNAGMPKYDVCHNGNTINVASPAVLNAHLDHGDTLGACSEEGGEGDSDEGAGGEGDENADEPENDEAGGDEGGNNGGGGADSPDVEEDTDIENTPVGIMDLAV